MDFKEYNDQIQELGTLYVKEGTRAWERYIQTISATPSGNWAVADAQKRYSQTVRNEGGNFILKLMQCNLDYYINLINTGLEFSNQLYNSASKPATSDAVCPSESNTVHQEDIVSQTEIHFTGKKGVNQCQAFVIANKQKKKIDVSFEISEFISEDGKNKVREPVTIVPEHFVLGEGEEQIVECQVLFDKQLTPGQRHLALVRVIGFPDMQVRLVVDA